MIITSAGVSSLEGTRSKLVFVLRYPKVPKGQKKIHYRLSRRCVTSILLATCTAPSNSIVPEFFITIIKVFVIIQIIPQNYSWLWLPAFLVPENIYFLCDHGLIYIIYCFRCSRLVHGGEKVDPDRKEQPGCPSGFLFELRKPTHRALNFCSLVPKPSTCEWEGIWLSLLISAHSKPLSDRVRYY